MAAALGANYVQMRREGRVLRMFPFSSARKRMTSLISQPGARSASALSSSRGLAFRPSTHAVVNGLSASQSWSVCEECCMHACENTLTSCLHTADALRKQSVISTVPGTRSLLALVRTAQKQNVSACCVRAVWRGCCVRACTPRGQPSCCCSSAARASRVAPEWNGCLRKRRAPC